MFLSKIVLLLFTWVANPPGYFPVSLNGGGGGGCLWGNPIMSLIGRLVKFAVVFTRIIDHLGRTSSRKFIKFNSKFVSSNPNFIFRFLFSLSLSLLLPAILPPPFLIPPPHHAFHSSSFSWSVRDDNLFLL